MYYLNRQASTPLYLQLFEQLKDDILNHQILTRLPSIRALATQLNVAKGTVVNAYELLVAEGVLESQPHRGYFVKSTEGMALAKRVNEPIQTDQLPEFDFTLQYASSLLTTHTKNAWNQAINEAIQTQFDVRLAEKIGYQGALAIRWSIAKLLRRNRGINCVADQIVITTGSSESLAMIVQILKNNGDGNRNGVIENPGYRQAFEILKRQGVRMIPVDVDEDGIQLASLHQLSPQMVYVTLSHQFPLGQSMSVKRRHELIELMTEMNGYVIEDDYDSDFSVKDHPLPALKAMDDQHVFYMSSFSKAISNDLRLGYLVLPKSLVPVYRNIFAYETNSVSKIIQTAMAKFIDSHAYERHILRMLTLNRRKFQLLKDALQPFCDSHLIEAQFQEAGIHLVFRLNDTGKLNQFERLLSKNKLYLRKMDQYWLKQVRSGYFIIGFAHFEIQRFEHALDKLVAIFKQLSI